MLHPKNIIKLIIVIFVLSLFFFQTIWANQIQETGKENVHMKVIVNFDFDKANIRPEAIPFLERIYEKIQQFPDSKTQLSGHTCAMGPEQYNIGLSYRRAKNVLRYFVDKKKVSKDRFLKPVGYGETQPIASNKTRQGRAQNRRVEITTFTGSYTLPPAYQDSPQQLGDVGYSGKPTLFGSILVYQYEKDASKNPGDLGGERRLVVAYGLSNGVVELSNDSGTKMYRRVSNEDGKFNFGEVEPDYWTLDPYEDYLPQNHYFAEDKISFELTAGMQKDVTVRILPEEHQSMDYNMDIQEGSGFGLTQGSGIISRFTVNFDEESAVITPEKEAILEFVNEVLKQFPHSSVQLEGHCDASENTPSLSHDRAENVRDFFVSKKGMDASRFNKPIGLKSKNPIALGTGNEDKAKNRRVEVIIYKSENKLPQ